MYITKECEAEKTCNKNLPGDTVLNEFLSKKTDQNHPI